MENTLENKSRFFAQYWSQRIAIQNEGGGSGFSYEINEATICDIKYDYLKFKQLSQITDEDAIEVATIVSNSIRDADTGDLVTLFYTEVKKDPYVLAFASYETVDYLRSKGYALPWMGLSVEQLISYGWIKHT